MQPGGNKEGFCKLLPGIPSGGSAGVQSKVIKEGFCRGAAKGGTRRVSAGVQPGGNKEGFCRLLSGIPRRGSAGVQSGGNKEGFCSFLPGLPREGFCRGAQGGVLQFTDLTGPHL